MDVGFARVVPGFGVPLCNGGIFLPVLLSPSMQSETVALKPPPMHRRCRALRGHNLCPTSSSTPLIQWHRSMHIKMCARAHARIAALECFLAVPWIVPVLASSGRRFPSGETAVAYRALTLQLSILLLPFDFGGSAHVASNPATYMQRAPCSSTHHKGTRMPHALQTVAACDVHRVSFTMQRCNETKGT